MGDGIILNTGIDMSGFQKGTKALGGAIKSLGKTAIRGSENVVKALGGMSKQAVKTVASMFGIVGVYAALHKAVNTYISQNRELSQKLSSIWTSLGNVLGPVIEQLVGWITQAVSYLLEFLRLLGVTTKTASQLSKAANGAAGGLQASLLGFDELNKLSAGGGGGGAGLDDVEMPDWALGLIDLIKGEQWDAAARMLADKINALFDGLDFKTVGEKFGQKINGILEFIGKAITWVDWTTLGNKLAEGINAILENVDGENLGAVLAAKFLILFETAGGFLETFDWSGAFKTITKTVESALTTINTAVDKVDFVLISDNLKAGIESIDFTGIATSMQSLLESGFAALTDIDISGILTAITRALNNAIQSVNWNAVGIAIGAWIGSIDVTSLVDAFGDLLVTAFQAAIELIKGIFSGLETYAAENFGEDSAVYKMFHELGEMVNAFGNFCVDVVPKIGELLSALVGLVGEPVVKGVTELAKATGSIFTTFDLLINKEIDFWDVLSYGTENIDVAVMSIDELSNEIMGLSDAYENNVSIMSDAHSSSAEISAALDNQQVVFARLKATVAEYGLQMYENGQIDKETYNQTQNMFATFESLQAVIEKLGIDWVTLNDITENNSVSFDVSSESMDAVETAATDVDKASTDLSDTTVDLTEDIVDLAKDYNDVKTAMDDYLAVTEDQKTGLSELTTTVEETTGAMVEYINTNRQGKIDIEKAWKSISSSIKDNGQLAASAMLTWKGAFDNAIASIAYSAYGWGSDLAVNLANGMNSAAWCVADASQNIADIIRSYIHFSEPDVGPLANFHTYMPDMIDEMVSGIEKNGSKVGGAMADLSAQMAEEAQNTELEIGNIGFDASMDSFADKIVDGFENLIERLSYIAENVNFAVPSFAGGLVAPYAVGDDNTPSGSNELIGAINALREAVIGTNNTQSNLWNIALSLDGQELATRITKIQKQNERARGY